MLKHFFVLFLMNVSHAWDWLRRLFGPVKPWQADLSMILSHLYLGGFFETWPEVDCVLSCAEENQYHVPPGKNYAMIARGDVPSEVLTLFDLEWTTDLIRGWLKCGYTVAVICDLGENRSGLVMCAYVAASMGLSAEKAREFVAAKRGRPVLHEWQFEALQDYVVSLGTPIKGPKDF